MTITESSASLVTAESLERAVAQLFEAVGVAPSSSAQIAEVLVSSDLRGVESHGVQFAPRYVRGIQRGHLNAAPKIAIARAKGATAVVDADNGLGFLSARFGMDHAVELAHTHGIGYVVVRNSNHFGPAAFYAMQALSSGMVGHATTDGPPHTVVWGSRKPVLSNDPVAWAFPTADGDPIVIDTAFTGVKEKIRLAAQRGGSIPGDWAVGPDGHPTTDPHAALEGALLPIGQHKGSALIVANELLCGALAGARFSFEVSPALVQGADHHDSWRCGHVLAAIDIAAFLDPGEFTRRASSLATALRSAPKAEGVDRIYMPGEPEAELTRQRLKEGIPLAATTVAALDAVAGEVGAPTASSTLQQP
ncbi:lactate dehydrogenase [Pseudonocardia sulfidoxydans NBRC 16205]|uniref:Lactate dehydrogenase n=1 Tax=Pseudonocardia sulfidoxydans NBRC 16205 TaxID=1223511 RepID=A0A511DRK2_9PSEU|nr:Ldh family oxidoreductase [Pseudonocardia sulfidoxydans]GEL26853.1 lactate dehydrogenase [Pseudonocardia sulfidoxydans NBRC 16205]